MLRPPRTWASSSRPQGSATDTVVPPYSIAARLLRVALLLPPAVVHAQDPDPGRSSLAGRLSPADTTVVPLVTGFEGVLEGSAALPQEALVHLGYIAERYPDAPSELSLLKAAMLEGEIAAAWARVSGVDTLDLERTHRAMDNVIHALDPEQMPDGAGMGFGFLRAAQAVGLHAQLATLTASDTVAPALAFHGPFMVRAAREAGARADDAVALARRIQGTSDPRSALRLVEQLSEALRSMMYGEDRDRDGRIGHVSGEGGIAQAAYHLALIYRVEGMALPGLRPQNLYDSLGLDTLGRQPDSVRFRRRRGF